MSTKTKWISIVAIAVITGGVLIGFAVDQTQGGNQVVASEAQHCGGCDEIKGSANCCKPKTASSASGCCPFSGK